MKKVVRFKRIISMIMSFLIVLGTFPVAALATGTLNGYGSVESLTSGGVVSGSETANTTVKYDAVELDWSVADPSVGKTADGWWIGFKVTAPVEMTTEDKFAGVSYQIFSEKSGWSESYSFWDLQDSDKENADTQRFVSEWCQIKQEDLNDAVVSNSEITYKVRFDWNADGEFEQVVELGLNSSDVTLKKDGVTIYSSATVFGSVDVISGGASLVSSNNGKVVELKHSSKTNLTWAAGSDGRNDGWAVGFKVTAPAGTVISAESDVNYQSKINSDSWSSSKSFNNDKNGDNYINLWSYVTDSSLKSGDAVNQWRFDWNKDGDFEQIIVLKIESAKIVLLDENGSQVYPELGTIVPITSGTVSGVAGNMKFTVDNAILEWSPKNETIGRYVDGWWAGMKVVAPEGMSEEQLNGVKYQRTDTSTSSGWSTDRDFWKNKDSKEGESSHYIGMWMLLNDEYLEQAKNNNKNLTIKYRFDWDKDGTFEQYITFEVVPSDGIVLKKIAQTGFGFHSNEAPADQWAGSTLTNTAYGGEGTGEVTYEIIEGQNIATIDHSSGKVIFNAAGLVTVKATKAASGPYEKATATYSVTVVKFPQTNFKFSTTGPVEITYNAADPTYTNTAVDGFGDGALTYRISEVTSGPADIATVNNDGVVTYKCAGTFIVEATKAGNDVYEKGVITYTITVNKAEQSTPIEFDERVPTELVYREEPYDVLVVNGGNGNGGFLYQIVDGYDVATIDNNGIITTEGIGTFTVQVVKDGDDCYKQSNPITTTITVLNAEQDSFAFQYPNPDNVIYNENGNKFTNIADGNETDGEVTYRIKSGDAAIIEDQTSGELTIVKAGTVIVEATKKGNETYKDKTIEYTLVIETAKQTFTFADGFDVHVKYGTLTYYNDVIDTVVTGVADGIGYGNGVLSVSVSENNIGAYIDENNKVAFKDSADKVGSVTVTVTRAADDCYAECSVSYTLTVEYAETPDPAYSLDGEKKNESGWYTNDVVVSAPEGYLISKSGALLSSSWSENVVISDEGITTQYVYIKNMATGHISNVIEIKDIKIEKTDPSDLIISYEKSLIHKVLETVTFYFYKAPVKVVVSATNLVSGVDSLSYNIGNGVVTVNADAFESNENGVATYSFELPGDYRGSISMSATSVAGRTVELTEEENVLVIDDISPEITVKNNYSTGKYNTTVDKIYTQGNVTVLFEVTDKNIDLADKPVVEYDGTVAELTWTDAVDGKITAELAVSGEGDHTIAITSTDASGNASTDSQVICIDSTAPGIKVEYNNSSEYEARKATVTVTEKNFNGDDVVVNLVSENIKGESLLDESIEPEWKVSGNDTYIAEVEITEDGIYNLSVDYTDYAGNDAESYSADFTIDNTAPTVAIDYSTPVIEKIIEAITFGFYNASVEVTFTATDDITGVDSFDWDYVKQPGTSEVNSDSSEDNKIDEDEITYHDGGAVATVVVTIPANVRGNITVDATDRAGNKFGITDQKVVVVDDISPKITLTYTPGEDTTVVTESGENQVYYNGAVTTTVEINEANFFEGDKSGEEVIHNVGILLTKTSDDGTVTKIEYLPEGAAQKYEDATASYLEWDTSGDVHTFDIDYTDDADYVLTVEYADYSGNTAEKTSKTITIDTTAPVINVKFAPYSVVKTDETSRDYLKGVTTATVKVTEHNFDANSVKFIITSDNGAVVKAGEWNKTGVNEYTAKIPFNEDANYSFDIEYEDIVGNKAVDYAEKLFTVVRSKPTITVEYTPDVEAGDYIKNENVHAKISVNALNFDAANITSDITAKDLDGNIIAVDDYNSALGSSVNWKKSGESNIYEAEIDFSVEAVYSINISYKDFNNNESEYVSNFTIDRTAPTVTIKYSTPVIEKIIETLTFGFYKAQADVTFVATDPISGVSEIKWDYIKEDGSSDKNSNSDLNNVIRTNGETKVEKSIRIPANARGNIKVDAVDKAGISTTNQADEKVIVVDNIAPKINVTYTPESNATVVTESGENQVYYNGAVTTTVEINEANFFEGDKSGEEVIHNVGILLTKTSDDGTVTKIEYLPEGSVQKYEDATASYFEWNTSGDVHNFDIKYADDADYVLTVEYADYSGNAASHTSKTITVDTTAPVIDVEFTPYDVVKTDATGRDYLNGTATAIIKVTEHNFNASDIDAIVSAKFVDLKTNVNVKNYKTYLKNNSNWTKTDGADEYTAVIVFDADANYSFDIEYTDMAKNNSADYSEKLFTVDQTKPVVKIEYSEEINFWQEVLNSVTFGYYSYNPSVDVTVTAEDTVSGVEHIDWFYNKESGSSNTNVSEKSGSFDSDELTYSADKATATAGFPLESVAETFEQFRGSVSVDVYDNNANKTVVNDDERVNIVDTIAPGRIVSFSEARVMRISDLQDVNSYAEEDHDDIKLLYQDKAIVTFKITEANFYKEDVKIKVNGKDVAPADWAEADDSDEWTGTITIDEQGDFVVTVEYNDRSNNEMLKYTSPTIAIDNEAPETEVEWVPATATANGKYFNSDRAATVTITEHNFRADDIVVNVSAKDVEGNSIADEKNVEKAISDYLTNRNNWKSVGDVHTAVVDFGTDAHYTFTVDYTDLANNAGEQYVADEFVIDKEAPSDLKVSYSEEINFWQEVLNTVTFGYYSYNPSVEVTISAYDEISGVDYFEWKYTKEDGTSVINKAEASGVIESGDFESSESGNVFVAKFVLPEDAADQIRGSISFAAIDMATNRSETLNDDKRINIVDTIDPERTVTYSDANQIVDAKTLETVESYDESSDVILYYQNQFTATVKITEANFYREDVIIQDNDANVIPADWTQNGDEWTATFTVEKEGDHVITITYMDRSDNEMKEYVSQRIVIDKTAPEISVDYSNRAVRNTLKDSENNNRKYFDDTQIATITVKEHNFRADDVIVKVKATNILGDNVSSFTFDKNNNVVEYFDEGKSRDEWSKLTPYIDSAKWRRTDDTYKLEIEYSKDANYTFDIEYKDLAKNSVADYQSDYFTVDKTAPTNLTVKYSTSILNKVLESVTFGYYNAKMTVTITADDITSGINNFKYSYVKSAGVSNVNAQLIDDAISSAAITHEGKTATATFTIPKMVLKNDNQFNGTVRFTAFDRSRNNTEKVDNHRIIVDNIKPVVKVTYNNPVKQVNNISYYSGAINATVVINEANFYAEDAIVNVTKNGNVHPVSVKWVDNNADVHTGTFTLNGDGDYIVTVKYADRSSNEMDTYTSNRLTIDTQIPDIKVSGIKMNSANKDDKYSFTITATDTNFDYSAFKPSLTAVVRDSKGNYSTKIIPLGNVRTVEAGKTYSYVIDNLVDDAVYTLICTAKDMSNNSTSKIVLDDGKAYDAVKFSINRKGSTFIADDNTKAIVDKYYVYGVDNDIVIDEINVDPVEKYTVKVNGNVLTEGKDFTSTVSSEKGKWSKRTYIIKKGLFAEEKDYIVTIESTDKTNTTAYSDVKNLNVSFVVDKTAPALTISGLVENGRYYADEQTVTVIPTDDGGMLRSFKVIAYDENGNVLKDASGKDISVRFDMSGEELHDYLQENNGKITFVLPEIYRNTIKVICTDYSLKDDGTTNELVQTFEPVTVSPYWWVIYRANSVLFYGTIAGAILVIGAGIFFIIYKKRKKDEE